MIKAVIFDLWGTIVEKQNDGNLKLADGCLEILKHLSEKKIAIGLATSMGAVNANEILDKFKINPFFEKKTFGTDVLNQKPDPEIFLKTADKLGYLPEECLIFEDHLDCINEAKRAGFSTIWKNYGENLRELFGKFFKIS